jgi:membrane protein
MSYFDAIRDAVRAYRTYKIQKLSAALAFYAIISLGPMLVVALYFATLFWGQAAAEGTMIERLQSLVGEQASLQMERLLRNTALQGINSFIGGIGLVTLLVAATTFFSDMHSSLNLLWDLKVKPGKGVRNLLLTRFLAFLIVLGLGVLLLTSLVIDSLVGMMIRNLRETMPGSIYLFARVFNQVFTFIVTTGLFALIFKLLPDADVRRRALFTGAAFTAILFTISKSLILYYLRRSSIDTTHGVAGSLVILLLWIYFSAMILYFGAAFTKAYARDRGGLQPNALAVPDRPEEVG